MSVNSDSIFAFVDDVVAKFSPQQVILFGSHAWGSATTDSDVDLLIIKDHRNRSAAEMATQIRLACPRRFALDLLVFAPSHLAKRMRLQDFFVKEIIERGFVLHDSTDTRVGAEGRRRLRQCLDSASLAQTQPV